MINDGQKVDLIVTDTPYLLKGIEKNQKISSDNKYVAIKMS